MRGICLKPLLISLESYEPKILMRLEKTNNSKTEKVVTARHPYAKPINVRQIMTVALTRPLRMFLEPMVLFTDLFLVLEYSIVFLYFEAYPFIFKGTSTLICKTPLGQAAYLPYRYIRYDSWRSRSYASPR